MMKKLLFTQAISGLGGTSIALSCAIELSKTQKVLYVELSNSGFSSDLYLNLQDKCSNQIDDIEGFGYSVEDCIVKFNDKMSIGLSKSLKPAIETIKILKDQFDTIVFDAGVLDAENCGYVKEFDFQFLICTQEVNIVRLTEGYISLLNDYLKNISIVINKTRIFLGKNSILLKIEDLARQFDISDCIYIGFDMGFLFGRDMINNASSKIRLGSKRMLNMRM